MEFGIKHVIGNKGDLSIIDNRENFYLLLFIKDQGSSLFIRNELVEFAPYTLVFIPFGEPIRANPNENRPFTLIYFNDTFYCRTEQDAAFLKNYRSFSKGEYAYRSMAAPKEFSAYYELVDMHLDMARQHSIEPIYRDLAHNFIKQILLLGAIYLGEKVSGELLSQGEDAYLVGQFQQLILEHVRQEKQVTFYADRLNVSPRKLNTATKEILGHTCKELITAGLIKLSKRYLLNSHLSIKQIAWELGYVDENNFSSIFSKESGISPTEYRKKWRV